MVFTLNNLIPFSFNTFIERATGVVDKIQNLHSQTQLRNDTKIPNGNRLKLKFLGKIKSLIAKLFDSKTLLRKRIAARYLTGNGIEIGALNSPLKVTANVKIRYLDRMSVSQLRQQYAELSKIQLVEPDIIDDGEVLASVADDSLDFVIANHLIDHCQNPIFSLENWLRVLKLGGVLYIAVPDKRYTFDSERSLTPLEHLIRDYNEGPLWSRNSHFEEWVRLVNKVPEKDVAAQAK